MNIKVIFGGLLASLLLTAQPAIAQGNSHDGLYIGAGGSYDDTSYTSTEIEPSPAIPYVTFPPINAYETSGIGSSIFVGYRQSSGWFTVAAEAQYGYNFASNNISATDTFETTNEFGATIMPGIWVNNDLVVFAKLGYSQLNMNRNFNGSLFNGTDAGLHLGGGVQVYVNDVVSLRADYTRSTYNHRMSSTIVSDLGGTLLSPQTFTVLYSNNIKRDRIQGSLIVNF